MAQNVQVCEVPQEVVDKLKKFRFRKEKNIAAIMLKVEKKTMKIIIEEEFDDCTIDELQAELPASQPRYLVISYVRHHDDGRVSYPLCFVFSSPVGCHPEQQMMYAGSVLCLIQTLGLTKTFDIRNPEEFDEEWLLQQLGKV
ncbi:glia maturation factor beta-like [Crassostrea angulata]|uniref:ADF-H domain-containing protein n=3 Tax=Magallana gigas TaxID=29159 RepID=A0A8W8ICA0_MAGGI|nr:glia maturation factor beta [Crassostrea gigas]XP_052698294.1 glia maturation factor beta-like [Crassostrea angulata]|eukprot:XP_011455796.1 PREDICTED: glia maturation factor beta [Crassostrea gigas]